MVRRTSHIQFTFVTIFRDAVSYFMKDFIFSVETVSRSSGDSMNGNSTEETKENKHFDHFFRSNFLQSANDQQ